MTIYKTVKLPEEVYKEALKLEKELEKNKEIHGVHRITISGAISYALTKTLKTVKTSHAFKSAGGWAGIDIDSYLKDIYKSRQRVRNLEVKF